MLDLDYVINSCPHRDFKIFVFNQSRFETFQRVVEVCR